VQESLAQSAVPLSATVNARIEGTELVATLAMCPSHGKFHAECIRLVLLIHLQSSASCYDAIAIGGSMSTEKERIQSDLDQVTKRIEQGDPAHRPPTPEKTGAACLASAKRYSESIISSGMRDRGAK
jgi:hypothetical protein